jgi:hypothetical protein
VAGRALTGTPGQTLRSEVAHAGAAAARAAGCAGAARAVAGVRIAAQAIPYNRHPPLLAADPGHLETPLRVTGADTGSRRRHSAGNGESLS